MKQRNRKKNKSYIPYDFKNEFPLKTLNPEEIANLSPNAKAHYMVRCIIENLNNSLAHDQSN